MMASASRTIAGRYNDAAAKPAICLQAVDAAV